MTQRAAMIFLWIGMVSTICHSSPVRSSLGAERNFIKKDYPYQAEVEWIAPDVSGIADPGANGPFIKTDYIPRLEDEVVFKMVAGGYESGHSLFGCCSGFRNHALATFQGELWFGNSSLHVLPAYSTISEIRVVGKKVYVNGNEVYDGSSVIDEPNIPITIFGFNNNNRGTSYRSIFKFKRMTAYRGGELILDLIPVIDKNGIVCLYDNASGDFLYNQTNLGFFIAGPEV